MRMWIIGLTVAFLAGCASVSEQSRAMAFNDIARLYAKTIAWSDFENLGAFIQFTTQNPPPDPKRLQDIKVTDYEPGPALGVADNKTVVRRAQIHYIESARMRARTLTVEEVWSYSEADGRWFLQSGWPTF